LCEQKNYSSGAESRIVEVETKQNKKIIILSYFRIFHHCTLQQTNIMMVGFAFKRTTHASAKNKEVRKTCCVGLVYYKNKRCLAGVLFATDTRSTSFSLSLQSQKNFLFKFSSGIMLFLLLLVQKKKKSPLPLFFSCLRSQIKNGICFFCLKALIPPLPLISIPPTPVEVSSSSARLRTFIHPTSFFKGMGVIEKSNQAIALATPKNKQQNFAMRAGREKGI